MQYTNPELPEGINTSKEHPLKEFFWLTSGVIASIAALALILVLLADFIVDYIPYSWEQQLSIPFASSNDTEQTPEPVEAYLQDLADRLSSVQDLPEGMHIKVHYINKGTINAFATLGGHVFFFRGLLEKMPNENALAMVMAHEIAHIKYRHPIHGLGRGVIIGILMSVINSAMGDAIMQKFLNDAGYLTVLKFNRDMENDSDDDAIKALLSLYGHLNGADDLFLMLQRESDSNETFEFFSTHPLTEKRINNLRAKANQQTTTLASRVTPLPDAFNQWLAHQDK